MSSRDVDVADEAMPAEVGATGSTAAGPRRPAVGRRAELAAVAGAGALGVLVFLVVHRSLIDDAYITLSYARNLAEHFHWGLTAARTANSATSPLNVLLLGLAAFVVRDAVLGLGVVFVVLTALQAAGLLRLVRAVRLPRTAALVAVAAVVLSPLMLSIVGMEMALAFTLVVWLTAAAAEGRAVWFGVLSAGLLLTRVDLLVFPLVLFLATRAVRRRWLVALGSAVLVALPWYVFSWTALGALVPDTLVIKTLSSNAWGPWDFGNGPRLFWQQYPAATGLSAGPALLGALAVVAWFATLAWRRPRWTGLGPVAALGVAGVAHYLAYTLLAPPPYHWYYAPSVTALTTVAVLFGAAAVGDRAPGAARPRLLLAGAGAVAAALLAVEIAFVVQRGLPWEQVPITTNWATAQEYRTVGEDLRDEVGDAVVSSPGEIGTIAYYCDCDIVDVFSDRGALAPEIEAREEESGPVMRRLLELNFATFDRPPAAVPDLALRYVSREDPAARWPVHSDWRGEGAFSLGAP